MEKKSINLEFWTSLNLFGCILGTKSLKGIFPNDVNQKIFMQHITHLHNSIPYGKLRQTTLFVVKLEKITVTTLSGNLFDDLPL